jgi:hypothetical protein
MKNNTNTTNTTSKLETIEKVVSKKNLHFRNNLDLVTNENKKVFQVRNASNKTNIYVNEKEYEMIKDISFKNVVPHTTKKDGSKVKNPYIAINNVSKEELEKAIEKVLIGKGYKKGKKA